MQAHRDLTVILATCFFATVTVGFVVVGVASGLSGAVRSLPTLLAIAVGGSVGVFVLLVIVAAFDMRRRWSNHHEADRLEHTLRRLAKQNDAADTEDTQLM